MFGFMIKKNRDIQYNKDDYISLSKLAKEFNTTNKDLENMLIELNYIKKKEKWIMPTIKGKSLGAVEKYNAKTKTKYTMFPKDMKIKITREEEAIANIINKIQNEPKEKRMTSKEKGDAYEEYIANYFRELKYTVWEHGKEKGVKDSGIDLFIKKEKYIYFVQCKNWNTWKINHKEVKATRTDVREYLQKNKNIWNIIKNYNMKILYVTPKKCLTPGAYKYIEENKEIVEHQVIPML